MGPASTVIRIVGQGLAGSLLAWACEREGIPFRLTGAGEGLAASRMAAGIINPITGQRIVKSWRVDELLPGALAVYREIEAVFNLRLVFPMRVRRFFRDDTERRTASEKHERGELAPYLASLDNNGFWIEPAFRIDTRRLVDSLRQHWLESGNREGEGGESLDSPQSDADQLTIWCRGAGELKSSRFAFAHLQSAKGEILTLNSGALDPAVILNDGRWVLPIENGQARVGATFARNDETLVATEGAREELSRAAQRLINGTFEVTGQEVGIRVTTSDKHPVVGRHPRAPQCGIINGLGSKGALLAPWLAQQWIAHLQGEAPFDAAVDVGRFMRKA